MTEPGPPAGHFHILTRTGEHLSGDGRQLAAGDVLAALDGTVYAEQPQILAVARGKLTEGCVAVPGGTDWVTATRCHGTSTDQCREHLTSVVIRSDLTSGYAQKTGYAVPVSQDPEHG